MCRDSWSRRLLNEPMPAGNYTVRWEAHAASGTYYYRLEVGGQKQTGQMTLLNSVAKKYFLYRPSALLPRKPPGCTPDYVWGLETDMHRKRMHIGWL
jgi:hypothetical protein